MYILISFKIDTEQYLEENYLSITGFRNYKEVANSPGMWGE